jgi:hypothetical protein
MFNFVISGYARKLQTKASSISARCTERTMGGNADAATASI